MWKKSGCRWVCGNRGLSASAEVDKEDRGQHIASGAFAWDVQELRVDDGRVAVLRYQLVGDLESWTAAASDVSGDYEMVVVRTR